MNTSCNRPLSIGGTIKGKWNKGSYRIVRGLGEGSNGKVYLVSRNNARYAMKMGFDALDLQSEVNILRVLSRMEGSFRNFLLDVDDYQAQGKDIPFYVMKYIEGRQLQNFLSAKGRDWFPLIGLRLLGKLCELHAKGYVFGDLKKENILVSGYGCVELVDFGGVTPMGKAVKQFTELYDRGYWNAGDRSADEGYDLFAFAILCIHVCGAPKSAFGKGVLPQNRSLSELLDEVRRDPLCRQYLPFLDKALTGGFGSSTEAYSAWRRLVHSSAGMNMKDGSKDKHPIPIGWLKAGFAASLLLLGTSLWYYW